MVRYQNLTWKPKLFRAPGPGYDVPPEPPSRRPCVPVVKNIRIEKTMHWLFEHTLMLQRLQCSETLNTTLDSAQLCKAVNRRVARIWKRGGAFFERVRQL